MKVILPAILLIALLGGCSKENQTELLTQKPTSEFFNHNVKDEPFRIFIIEYLKQIDDSIPFAEDFVSSFGTPIWDVGLSNETNGCNSLLVPIKDTKNRSISALYYFKHESQQLEYCLLLNDKDADHYKNTQRLIQYFEKTLKIEKTDKSIDVSIKRPKSSLKTNYYVFENCVSWTQVTEFGSSEHEECSYEFFHTSGPPSSSGSGSVGHSNANVNYSKGNGGSGTGNGGPGSGDGDNDSGVKPYDLPEITSDFQDYPCAQRTLDSFTNFNSLISNLLREVFNQDCDLNINFSPDSTLVGTNTAGQRNNGSLTDIDGRILGTLDISINPDMLNNATIEYIAATYAHEAIHAIIQYYETYDKDQLEILFPLFVDPRRSTTVDNKDKDEHERMAAEYIDAMVDIILKINPNFSGTRAEELAWAGLEDTWAYELKKIASLEDANGVNFWENKVRDANQAERNSTPNAQGTRCR